MLIVVMPNSVYGKMPKGTFPLPEELKELPRWCQIRFRSYGAMRGYTGAWTNWERPPISVLRENKKWEKLFGAKVYNGAHHYIYGLNWINRHKRYSILRYEGVERDLNFALNTVISEFKFMRAYVRPKHKLYPMMLMQEAYAYKGLGNYKKAAQLYTELMKRNPGYAPVYVEYANLLKSVGKSKNALKVLQIGLKKTKGSKQIKQALAVMGGAGN
jgi:tetratricopeptide (TPR) repeat protein